MKLEQPQMSECSKLYGSQMKLKGIYSSGITGLYEFAVSKSTNEMSQSWS